MMNRYYLTTHLYSRNYKASLFEKRSYKALHDYSLVSKVIVIKHLKYVINAVRKPSI